MNDNRIQQVADDMAAEMRRKLDSGLTPADLGWPNMSANELVLSEWRAWVEEETRVLGLEASVLTIVEEDGGWVICADGRPISKPFEDKTEALWWAKVIDPRCCPECTTLRAGIYVCPPSDCNRHGQHARAPAPQPKISFARETALFLRFHCHRWSS